MSDAWDLDPVDPVCTVVLLISEPPFTLCVGQLGMTNPSPDLVVQRILWLTGCGYVVRLTAPPNRGGPEFQPGVLADVVTWSVYEWMIDERAVL